jgi:hypothetical protein
MAHKRMVQQLLQVRAHLILCLRAEDKTEMVKDERTGKIEFKPKQTLAGFRGWIPICEKRVPFELTASIIVTPDKPGHPQPIKLNGQHRPFFPLDTPIGEEAGRRLAEWARGGGAPLTASPAPVQSAPPATTTAPPTLSSGPPAGDERIGLVDAIKAELDAIVSAEGKPREAILQEIFGTRQWARVERGLDESALRQGLVKLMARRPTGAGPDPAPASDDEESPAFKRMMDDSTPDARAALLAEIEPLRAALGYTGAVWKDVCKEQMGLSTEWADAEQLVKLRDYLHQIGPTTA